MLKKKEFHGVCVMSRIGGGVTGMACTIRMAKELPKKTSRIIGNQECKTYWFETILEAQAFYDKTWTEMRRTA